jgi:hypothetical protein
MWALVTARVAATADARLSGPGQDGDDGSEGTVGSDREPDGSDELPGDSAAQEPMDKIMVRDRAVAHNGAVRSDRVRSGRRRIGAPPRARPAVTGASAADGD